MLLTSLVGTDILSNQNAGVKFGHAYQKSITTILDNIAC